ncbi:MAG TPA: FCD domain-containing protein [Jiangellales bacterium]|nr:FCD domain-containing protein [Jiangellales bacterium]
MAPARRIPAASARVLTWTWASTRPGRIHAPRTSTCCTALPTAARAPRVWSHEPAPALEVLVCRRAALRLGGAGGEALQVVLGEARDALAEGDVEAAVRADARFHTVLLQVSRSPALQSVLEPVNDRLQWLLRQHPDPQVLYEEHRAIADAVRAGDAERAAELAGQHLRTSRQQYERSVRALAGPG